jgi:aryl-alcohol dehydrogenase-like predicted oxidoreductase
LSAHTYKILNGYATPSGTKEYVQYALQRGIPSAHFRLFDGLYLSSIGMGTYLGQPSAEDDNAMENAVYESIKSGAVNVIDTAINYRAMKSEKTIGRALLRLETDGIISRDKVFVCTKNGYITNDGDYSNIDVMEYMQKMFISTGIIEASEISSGYNVLNPSYIRRCIDKSLSNMRVDAIDLVYIHNSFESWHEDISKEEFMDMLSKVFDVYEKYRSIGKIRYYGMATWTCFRVMPDNKEYLSLQEVVKLAEKVGGKEHGFRFIQLPYNLAYSEALLLKSQSVGGQKNLTILEAAEKLGIRIFTSIPLFQSRLLRAQIPDYMGLSDQVLKLVQVIRSSPSVIAPLIGYKKKEHLEQDLKIAEIPPLNSKEFEEVIHTLLKGNS